MNERIKAIRKKMGLSQSDFAERIAISRSALAKIESGEMRPSVYRVLPMAQAEQAHDILYRSENIGKVVLRVHEEV